jgi:hypothetical protein
MPSQIDPSIPPFGDPATQSVRENFQHAAAEISALQAAVGDVSFPDAPNDGIVYARLDNEWTPVVSESGGDYTGPVGFRAPGIHFPTMTSANANYQFAWSNSRIWPYVNGIAQGALAYLTDVTAPSVTSVAGRAGDIILTHTDITDWTATLTPYALASSVPLGSNTMPIMAGNGTAGTAATWARGDHVHPADNTRAPLDSPSFTGLPVAPTAPSGTNSSQLATTAYVTAAVTVAEAAGVSSFNTRTGAVVLTVADMLSLGFITSAVSDIRYVMGAGDQMDGPLDMKSNPIHNVPAPTAPLDVANKSYVDSAVSGVAVGVSSFNTRTGAITLTSGDVTTALTFTPYNATNPSGYQTASQVSAVLPVASSTLPSMDGAAAIGTGTTWARSDHVHPADTTRAPLASPNLTGTPTAPTATAGTNTTQLATTAFVGAAISAGAAGVSSFNTRTGAVTLTNADVIAGLTFTPYNATNPNGYQTAANVTTTLAPYALTANVPAASTTTPAMDGTAAVGTGTTWARSDHVHPIDTSRYAASNPSNYVNAAGAAAAAPVQSFNTRTGAIALTSGDVTTALTFTPYNATNPSGYQTAANVTTSLAPYTLLAGGNMTGVLNLKGTVAADSAASGVVGEFISASQATATSLTTATALNLATLALTAGDWDVWGQIIFTPSAAPSSLSAAVGSTSATLPTAAQLAAGNGAATQLRLSYTSAQVQTLQTGMTRVNVSATTNIFLLAQATFASGTVTAQGFISARRAR